MRSTGTPFVHPWSATIRAGRCLFGVAPEGGRFDGGVLFQIQENGAITGLVHFSNRQGDTPGGRPLGIIALEADEVRLWGVTAAGGRETQPKTAIIRRRTRERDLRSSWHINHVNLRRA